MEREKESSRKRAKRNMGEGGRGDIESNRKRVKRNMGEGGRGDIESSRKRVKRNMERRKTQEDSLAKRHPLCPWPNRSSIIYSAVAQKFLLWVLLHSVTLLP